MSLLAQPQRQVLFLLLASDKLMNQFDVIKLFIALVILLVITGSTNFILLENFQLQVNQQISLTICFIFGFGMKVPIFPFHI